MIVAVTGAGHWVGIGLVGALGLAVTFLTSLRTKALGAIPALMLVGWVIVHFPGSVARALPDAIVLVVLAHFVWDLVRDQLDLPWTRPYVVFTLLFGAAVAIQAGNPVIRAVGGGSTGARTYLVPMGMFFIGLAVMRTGVDARSVLKVLVVTTALVDAYLVKQMITGFDHSERAYWASSGSGVLGEHKLFSTLVSPDTYGLVAAVLTLACLAAYSAGIWRRASLPVAAVSALGAFASGVRMAAAALVLGLVVFLLAKLYERSTARFAVIGLVLLATGAVVLGTAVAATPVEARYNIGPTHNSITAPIAKLAILKEGTADQDLNSRLTRAREFYTYILRHPWGAGPEVINALNQASLTNAGSAALLPGGGAPAAVSAPPPRLPRYMLDQPWIFQHDYFYIDLGVELGLIPLILFVLLLLVGVVLALECARSRAVEPEVHSLLCLAAGGIVVTLVCNVTNEAFRTPEASGLVWFLMALPVAYALSGDRRVARPPGGAQADDRGEPGSARSSDATVVHGRARAASTRPGRLAMSDGSRARRTPSWNSRAVAAT